MNNLICEMPLGLDFVEILLHLLNFALLIVGLRFLLYKPIKKFMQKREEEYRANEEANKKAKEEADALKTVCKELVNEARDQAVLISEEATSSAKLQTDEILREAQASADKLIEKSKKDAEIEKQKAREEVVYSATELACAIASKLLEREVKTSDNDQMIKDVVENWKKD